jgi:osmotically-inducible protein OsmY
MRLPALAATGAATGALLMYYLDPHAGRRRRALARDRAAHLARVFGRDVPRGIERRGRLLRGRARGLSHEAAELVHLNGHGGIADNETLVARVRSEALRDARVQPGEINIDAYEGCVTLRGQVESEGVIEDLVRAVRHIDGVTAVRSYLHLPGTPPPNKAESVEHVPAHLHTV